MISECDGIGTVDAVEEGTQTTPEEQAQELQVTPAAPGWSFTRCQESRGAHLTACKIWCKTVRS